MTTYTTPDDSDSIDVHIEDFDADVTWLGWFQATGIIDGFYHRADWYEASNE